MTTSFPVGDSGHGPRLVLHAPMTNVYWVIITGAVIGLVKLPGGMYELWRTEGGHGALVFGAIASVILIFAIAYLQRKARWLVAEPRGLEITERSRLRLVPWRDVRCLTDLGYLGGAPGAKRVYLELSDGTHFTFLADPDALSRLDRVVEAGGCSLPKEVCSRVGW